MTEYGFSFALEGFQTAFLIAVTAYSSVSVMDMLPMRIYASAHTEGKHTYLSKNTETILFS